ncbi:hypothetical protein V6N13_017515 [Hibiscus sabdariffa]
MDDQLDHILRPNEQSPEMWGTNGHNPLASPAHMTRLYIRTLCWSYDEASPYTDTTTDLGWWSYRLRTPACWKMVHWAMNAQSISFEKKPG